MKPVLQFDVSEVMSSPTRTRKDSGRVRYWKSTTRFSDKLFSQKAILQANSRSQGTDTRNRRPVIYRSFAAHCKSSTTTPLSIAVRTEKKREPTLRVMENCTTTKGGENMQRIALLFLVTLACVTSVHAQSSSDTRKLNGTVCDASCVVPVDNASTCDKSCTAKSGEAVLVDDQGKVMHIANQEVCKSHMGKHVTATVKAMDQPSAAASPTEMQREQELEERQRYFEVLQIETLEPL
jgi:hypothetical protein